MAVKITQKCTHDDKEYDIGDVVKKVAVAKALVAAGVAEEVTAKDTAEE